MDYWDARVAAAQEDFELADFGLVGSAPAAFALVQSAAEGQPVVGRQHPRALLQMIGRRSQLKRTN